jgi:tRNA pseudouridine55 synthase
MFRDFREGEVILINKPYRWTSFDAVNKVRSVLKYRLKLGNVKTGHAGTLDPLATGLLIICSGKFTKRIEEFQAFEKEYTGTFILGATTPSFDLETAVVPFPGAAAVSEEALRQAADELCGNYEQIPPVFSARFIDGKRAYEYAREGEEVEMKGRSVSITRFDITRYEWPEADFRIICSKGTYIRSIARDLGQKLETGAYLSALCRTRIGRYRLEEALSLSEFEKEAWTAAQGEQDA